MATDRTAQVTWHGSLMEEGSGTITSTTSGAIGEQPVHGQGVARRGRGQQGRPRGHGCGGACRVLRDGAFARARAGRHSGRRGSIPRRR
jgi:hypothetical protein